MDIYDYAEEKAGKTLAVLRDAYDHLHERAFKFASLLMAGGGAVGAFALGKVGQPAVTWVPLAIVAGFWFGTAALLMWRGAMARAVSPGNGPKHLIDYYDTRIAENEEAATALLTTRRGELDRQQARIDLYIDGCDARSEAINLGYKMAAIGTPVVLLVASVACRYWK